MLLYLFPCLLNGSLTLPKPISRNEMDTRNPGPIGFWLIIVGTMNQEPKRIPSTRSCPRDTRRFRCVKDKAYAPVLHRRFFSHAGAESGSGPFLRTGHHVPKPTQRARAVRWVGSSLKWDHGSPGALQGGSQGPVSGPGCKAGPTLVPGFIIHQPPGPAIGQTPHRRHAGKDGPLGRFIIHQPPAQESFSSINPPLRKVSHPSTPRPGEVSHSSTFDVNVLSVAEGLFSGECLGETQQMALFFRDKRGWGTMEGSIAPGVTRHKMTRTHIYRRNLCVLQSLGAVSDGALWEVGSRCLAGLYLSWRSA